MPNECEALKSNKYLDKNLFSFKSLIPVFMDYKAI